MKQTLEITIIAEIPDDKEDLGHEAVVSTKEPIHAIVTALHAMGLTGVRQTRRLVRKKEPAVVSEVSVGAKPKAVA